MKTANRTALSFLFAMLACAACLFGLVALSGCSVEEAVDVVAQEALGGSEESSGSGSQDDEGAGEKDSASQDDDGDDDDSDGEDGGD